MRRWFCTLLFSYNVIIYRLLLYNLVWLYCNECNNIRWWDWNMNRKTILEPTIEGNHIQTSHLESITFHRNPKVITSLVARFCFGCRFYGFFVHHVRQTFIYFIGWRKKNRMFKNLIFVWQLSNDSVESGKEKNV